MACNERYAGTLSKSCSRLESFPVIETLSSWKWKSSQLQAYYALIWKGRRGARRTPLQSDGLARAAPQAPEGANFLPVPWHAVAFGNPCWLVLHDCSKHFEFVTYSYLFRMMIPIGQYLLGMGWSNQQPGFWLFDISFFSAEAIGPWNSIDQAMRDGHQQKTAKSLKKHENATNTPYGNLTFLESCLLIDYLPWFPYLNGWFP